MCWRRVPVSRDGRNPAGFRVMSVRNRHWAQRGGPRKAFFRCSGARCRLKITSRDAKANPKPRGLIPGWGLTSSAFSFGVAAGATSCGCERFPVRPDRTGLLFREVVGYAPDCTDTVGRRRRRRLVGGDPGPAAQRPGCPVALAGSGSGTRQPVRPDERLSEHNFSGPARVFRCVVCGEVHAAARAHEWSACAIRLVWKWGL